MNVTLIGLDLAKQIIQVCGVNQAGKSVFNKAIKRSRLPDFLAQYPGVLIAMEACSSSHYWGRMLQERGYPVRLIPPQHVKPFVKGNKNDQHDAFAVTEAARRPNMVFVQPRSLQQTDMILSHKVRERRVQQRTALINQLRGLMGEYGVVIPIGKETLQAALPELLEDAGNDLTPVARQCFADLLLEWRALDQAITSLDREIRQQCRNHDASQRLVAIKGVGELTATAAVAIIGNGAQYRNGRHLAANLGLVPKEHSSGGKQRLGSITKRGNVYLRHLLIQGGWSIIRHCQTADDRLSRWARQLIERRGKHRVAVALANKLARIIWAMLNHQTPYQAG